MSLSPQPTCDPDGKAGETPRQSRLDRVKSLKDSLSLRLRLISSIILIPVVAAVVYAGGWWFLASIVYVAVVSAQEFVTLMRSGGYKPSLLVCLSLILLFIVDSVLPGWRVELFALPTFIMAALIWQLFHQTSGPIVDWALSVAFGLYLGIVLSSFLLLRNGPDGRSWMAYTVLVSWAIDGAAYGVGRAWGKHKLWLQVSPGKTWEGAIGGWLAGVGASLFICWLIGASYVHGLALGVLVATISPYGDLAISMLKRQVGAKDSGNLIPGHGGALDRLDSMFFLVLIVRLYVVAFITG